MWLDSSCSSLLLIYLYFLSCTFVLQERTKQIIKFLIFFTRGPSSKQFTMSRDQVKFALKQDWHLETWLPGITVEIFHIFCTSWLQKKSSTTLLLLIGMPYTALFGFFHFFGIPLWHIVVYIHLHQLSLERSGH